MVLSAKFGSAQPSCTLLTPNRNSMRDQLFHEITQTCSYEQAALVEYVSCLLRFIICILSDVMDTE